MLPGWNAFYAMCQAHAARVRADLETARTITLTATVSQWVELLGDGDLTGESFLYTHISNAVHNTSAHELSILLTEAETQHVLAQAEALKLNVTHQEEAP